MSPMLTSLNEKLPALIGTSSDITDRNSSQASKTKGHFLPQKRKHTKKKKAPWKRKPSIGADHAYLTLKFFMANTYWKHFKLEDSIFACLFWTGRHDNHSLREMQADFKKILMVTLYRRTLCDFFRALVAQGFLLKQYNFRKTKRGITKAHHRNYYVLTPKGRAYMDALVYFAMTGEMPDDVVAPEIKICGTVVKTPAIFMKRDWAALKSDKSVSGRYLQKLYHHEKSSYSVRTQNKCQVSGHFSIEVTKNFNMWSIYLRLHFDSDPPIQENSISFNSQNPLQGSLHPWNKNTSRRKSRLEQNIHKKIFEDFGYAKQFEKATDISKLFWAKQSESAIKKVLGLAKKKQSKGYRIKNFEKFLYRLIQDDGNSFHSMKAKMVRSALDGNKTILDNGIDTRDILDKMTAFERSTDQKIDEKTLSRLMCYPTHLLKRALEGVDYRMNGTLPKDKPSEEKKGSKKPIYETKWLTKKVEVYNPKTGKDEVRERKEKVCKIIGYEEDASPMNRKRTLSDVKAKPVRSWIGLLIYALKLGSIEAINEKFFRKKQ